jgi:alkanesulfonate monooxygenase SsuD/methylene tetrahydromethanopterin reductase-like flavin-dependent oxidoreductase (luciferase family)
MDRLEEAIHVIKALWSEGPASYEGKHYRVDGVNALPKPVRPGGPPILIGGSGEKRTLKLVAKHAAEWNSVNLPAEAYRGKVEALQRHCEAEGRDPGSIRRSMMMFAIVGPSEKELDMATRKVMSMWGAPAGATMAEYREGAKGRGMLVGGVEEIVDRLGQLGELGLQEVDFQHFDFDSEDVPAFLAGDVRGKVAAL